MYFELDQNRCYRRPNGLVPRHMTNQNQLNEWEQVNILEAEKWINQQNLSVFSYEVHL